jgi:hypothetical protein
MRTTIEIIVSPTGQTRLETKGFAGASCKDASRFIENALGRKVSEQAAAERTHGIERTR